MSAAAPPGPSAEAFLAGSPVAVSPAAIDHELSAMWKPLEANADAGASVTRACISNVVFYLPTASSAARAQKLVLGVGRRLPSRMILLTHDEDTGAGERLSATINAVCHRSGTSGPPVCCEQISLRVASRAVDLFPGAVVPLLVPDVPVNLVLLEDGGLDLYCGLADVVDRVVFDSRNLEPKALRRVREVLAASPCPAADDLAWRDTVGWRCALSEIFDDASVRSILSPSMRLEVHHAAGARVQAELLRGWFESRLGIKLSAAYFPTGEPGVQPGRLNAVRLEAGAPAGGAFVAVRRIEGSSLLRVEYHTPSECVIPRTLFTRFETDDELLGGALERTTHQEVLRAALDRVVS